MATLPSTHEHLRTDQHSALERQLKQERLDLIRSMAFQIDSPSIIESHCVALTRIQERLENLRHERKALGDR